MDIQLTPEILKALREFPRIPSSESEPEQSECVIEIRNQDKSELYISGTIEYYNGTRKVSEWLGERNGDVTIGLNSRGGDAWEGVAIASLLLNYDRGQVTTRIDGRAASAAGVIFLAGDKRQIMNTARLMLHEASLFGYVQGNYATVKTQTENMLSAMKEVNDSIVQIVSEASGMSKENAAKLITENDKYFDAKSAVSEKLATEVLKPNRRESKKDDSENSAKEFGVNMLESLGGLT